VSSYKKKKSANSQSKPNRKRRIFIYGVLALIVLIATLFTVYLFLPATSFSASEKIIIIRSNETCPDAFLKKMRKEAIIQDEQTFKQVADLLNIWPRLQPGKFRIQKNSGLLTIVMLFRKNKQLTNKLVIQKIRTKEQFARLVSQSLECGETEFLRFITNKDSLLRFGLNTETLLSVIFPDTYYFKWDASPSDILEKLQSEQIKFWTEARISRAEKLGITPIQAYILASIVEEETLIAEDKPLIASVYLNRYKKNMNLGSCPTVKFALRDFGLRRILSEHILRAGNSPYNTYKFAGLPPGPICTPSRETLKAVLEAEETEYLYFCAKANSGGRHAFAKTYEEHMENARLYQKWLNEKKIR
jgi:UPF0755 protein